MSVLIVRVVDDWPGGFPSLLDEAAHEGVRNMAALVTPQGRCART